MATPAYSQIQIYQNTFDLVYKAALNGEEVSDENLKTLESATTNMLVSADPLQDVPAIMQKSLESLKKLPPSPGSKKLLQTFAKNLPAETPQLQLQKRVILKAISPQDEVLNFIETNIQKKYIQTISKTVSRRGKMQEALEAMQAQQRALNPSNFTDKIKTGNPLVVDISKALRKELELKFTKQVPGAIQETSQKIKSAQVDTLSSEEFQTLVQNAKREMQAGQSYIIKSLIEGSRDQEQTESFKKALADLSSSVKNLTDSIKAELKKEKGGLIKEFIVVNKQSSAFFNWEDEVKKAENLLEETKQHKINTEDYAGTRIDALVTCTKALITTSTLQEAVAVQLLESNDPFKIKLSEVINKLTSDDFNQIILDLRLDIKLDKNKYTVEQVEEVEKGLRGIEENYRKAKEGVANVRPLSTNTLSARQLEFLMLVQKAISKESPADQDFKRMIASFAQRALPFVGIKDENRTIRHIFLLLQVIQSIR